MIMNSLLKLFISAVLGLILCTAALAISAPLTLDDLRHNPERWPTAITVPKDLQFQGGATVKKGQVVRLVEFKGAEAVVENGKGLVFGLPATETDLLARANEIWAKLTPAQREIDAVSLSKNRALWPLRVWCADEFELSNGTVLKPGEYELMAVGRDEVQLYSAAHKTVLNTRLQSTDLIERARALALVPVAQRPSRIVAAIKGKLVNAAGKAADPAGLEETQVFALYYGASWCAPCRAFSPDLVKFVERVAAANPRLTVVLMSNDKSDAAMYGYMREEKMPWTALRLSDLTGQRALTAYMKGGIPQLVVVDRQGMVLADSYRGATYIGPVAAMQELERILEKGLAK